MSAVFGIAALGNALGEPRSVEESAPDYTHERLRVRNWGFRTFHRAPDDTGLTDLAAAAGRRALADAGLAAGEVDLVVLAVADIPEHLYWDPSASTQNKLGAHRAESVLVNQACASGVAAFDTVAGKFATHPDYRVALLVAANRVCEAYWNRMDSSPAVSSDGATAAVLVRGHPRNRWLTTEVITDGRYADFSHLRGGGAARPFTEGAEPPGQLRNPAELMDEFLGHDVRATIRVARLSRQNLRAVVEEACKRASVPPESLRHILHMNGSRKGMQEFARAFGIPLDRTNAEISLDHGHFGCADQMFALGEKLARGEVREGDVVALTSTGNGMHWACTLLRI
ncbi:3-oxoacyl-[acyl-carrier-protein] synthase III C-terminal domain-containing protein [Sphaerisporangium rhizosphaerae]|uniref:3-oxoacyl-[acyl-carrier-protein] synthase III C-terminal domain-containing protein n=1 Tax=Sphaerisporangium rhizosphaerae TaxID=2269375 RepID=A0ABW2PIW9_9ACTN